jgi:predicted O-linked N-acetylglucosamine transferase (SPINDLY family)
MGVPVVTLVGGTVVGRAGLSQLMNLRMPELIARTPDQYVALASTLAGDVARLTALRQTLRERMRSSPLMDAPRFARTVETAYREMWRRWCAGIAACADP